MSSDTKDDTHNEEECACCIKWTRLLAPAVVAIRIMEDARMIAAATCTEEKFSWEPPVGPVQAYTRVALIPGTSTVETGLTLDTFRSGRMPGLMDVDFTIPGPVLWQRMLNLGNQSDTYMTVRTGVTPACIHTLCNTSYVQIRINTTSLTECSCIYTLRIPNVLCMQVIKIPRQGLNDVNLIMGLDRGRNLLYEKLY
jgi:hypothetical protein